LWTFRGPNRPGRWRRHDKVPGGLALTQTIRVQPSRVQRHHGRRIQGRRARRRFLGELPFLLLAALLLTVLVKGFLIQAFFIPSRSMEPTLDVGDRVVVNRLAYRIGEPAHGDVVVFLRPTGDGAAQPGGPLSWVRSAVAQGLGGTPPGNEDLIKRVVGLPGDKIQGKDGLLWRNGRRVAEHYLAGRGSTSDFGPVQVKPGHYWVMGDNREDSADSRVFGQVPESTLVGRAVFTVWPVTHVGGF
jgi:signal peptidase I